MNINKLFLIVAASSVFSFYTHVSACSTFLLSSDSCRIVGHNLDGDHEVPGYLIINNRGVYKTSISWIEIIMGEKKKNKRINWISKYGSVTMNPGGAKEFPDGGMNEKGLVICEMSLGNTSFPQDSSRVKMFMMQWIQYQLDNFSSVTEVLKHLDEFELDGWGWHFFIADKAGNKTVIEFINKTTIIYIGDRMQYPVLCNTQYADELKYIKSFKKYGGVNEVDLANKEDKNRFVNANFMIDNWQSGMKNSSVEYGFDILLQLSIQNYNKWSIIYDINNLKVHFRTAHASKIKQIDFQKIDFSCKNVLTVYNLDTPSIEGDILTSLQTYDFGEVKKTLNRLFKNALKNEFFLKRALAKVLVTRGMINYNKKVFCRLEE
jgi:penicillin V acylase-like amidase (Ntn superfamily)